MDSSKKTAAKPAMLLKWADEPKAKPIARDLAAKTIRGNRNQPRALRVSVVRKFGETYITSDVLGVGCVIYRADRLASSPEQK